MINVNVNIINEIASNATGGPPSCRRTAGRHQLKAKYSLVLPKVSLHGPCHDCQDNKRQKKRIQITGWLSTSIFGDVPDSLALKRLHLDIIRQSTGYKKLQGPRHPL